MPAFPLEKYMKSRQALVEKALRRRVPAGKPAVLHRAMRYSLFAGGKRIRPLLLLAAAEACGARAEDVLDAACAFECIHTYSLIHDDLPALDDDDLRRGKPTSHKVFGEATAILAGDGLLTLAFELMAAPRAGRPAADGLLAVRLLARAAGPWGMVGGQVMDLEGEGKELGRAGLAAVHAGKTGALLTAAVECGAVLAGASAARRRALAAYGRRVGLAFQIADDILNVVGEEKKLGKKTGSDQERQKSTYPSLYGLERSKELARQELKGGLDALKPFGAHAEALRALARFVVEREY
jgi:geranylgeranyl diphosphate synthase type II